MPKINVDMKRLQHGELYAKQRLSARKRPKQVVSVVAGEMMQ